MNGNLRIDLIRDYRDSSDDAQTIAAGSPFYYNWNPAGTQLVFHRNNRRVDVYDVSTQEILTDTQQTSSGTFQAPAWSPVDDRILAGTPGDEARKTNLTITAGNTSQNLLSNLAGNISFLWSPDGNYVAYRAISEGNFGALFVIDAISGEIVSRSSTSDVIAFFWSPDSRQIAYITFATPVGSFDARTSPLRQTIDFVQNTEGLAWATLNIETGLNRSYSSFFPTSEVVYLLLYFDQFAVSHRVWSPDSHYIVYSEVTTLGSQQQPVINILDVRQANSVPLTIARGVFAVWSMK
jgi:TolB protein